MRNSGASEKTCVAVFCVLNKRQGGYGIAPRVIKQGAKRPILMTTDPTKAGQELMAVGAL